MKYKRIISAAIAVSILLGGVCYIADIRVSPIDVVKSLTTQSDIKLAEDISNLTGESSANILKLRSESENWNDVMKTISSDEEYDRFMSDEELEQKIAEKQFSTEKVRMANEAVAQLQFNLKEINSKNKEFNTNPTKELENLNSPKTNKVENKDEINLEEFGKLSQSIDKNFLVYACLAFVNEFGTIDSVIDEYLYALQVNVDFRLYENNKEEYQKLILEKEAELMRIDAITVQKISETLFKLQTKEKYTENESENVLLKSNEEDMNISDKIVPEIKDPRPKDPTQQIMDELNELRNNSIGG